MTEPGRPPRINIGGLARLRAAVQEWGSGTLDLVFPPRCVNCKRAGSLFCESCRRTAQAAPLSHREMDPLSGLRASLLFEGAVRSAIHALKYESQQRIAGILSEWMVTTLRSTNWTPELITAVPLHEERLRERGYNQSALLARYISQSIGIPFVEDAIWRTRQTRQQVGLGFAERQLNVSGAFAANQMRVREKSVIIVDDVLTTGATLRSCGTALIEAGVTRVWALTLASASEHTPS